MSPCIAIKILPDLSGSIFYFIVIYYLYSKSRDKSRLTEF